MLKHMQMVMGYILRYEDHFRAVMEQQVRVESAGKIQASRKQLDRDEKRISELKRLFVKIYEDNASGRLSDERFDMLSQNYEAEQKQLEAEVIRLRQEIEVQERQNDNIEKFIQKAHKYVGIETLEPYALRDWCRPFMWRLPTSPAASAARASTSSTMAWASSLWMS